MREEKKEEMKEELILLKLSENQKSVRGIISL